MNIDFSKADLNKPAFGAGSQTLEDLREKAPEEEVKPEGDTQEEVKPEQNKEEEESVEESKVPYSRFKKFHDGYKEMAQKLAELEAERDHEPRREVKKYDEAEMDRTWLELYGDSEASRKAYQLDLQRREELREEMREEARQTLRQERENETTNLKKNLSTIDENIEELQDIIGRNLTQKEEEALLDVVDEYTPKDKNGNYLGATIPFEKAWEIYELKKNSSQASKKQARDDVASKTGSQTLGDTSSVEERNKNFNPLDWNAWKNRL